MAARVRDLLREHEAATAVRPATPLPAEGTFLGGLVARHRAGTSGAADDDSDDDSELDLEIEGRDDVPGLVGGEEGSPDPPGATGRGVGRRAARLPLSVRLDPGRRTALVFGGVVALVAVLIGAWLIASRPRELPVSAVSHHPGSAGPVAAGGPSVAGAAPPARSGPASAATASTVVVVDVAGKVRHPGLYRLPAGSRVDDAIRAAGGARRGVDLSTLNLAAKVVDGQQIAVGTTGAPAAAAPAGGDPPAPAGGDGTAASGGPVDLNTASLTQLETLPGVGPVLGQHIVDYRSQHGRFGSVDELRNVSGIGDVRFTQLRPLVTV